MRYLPWAVLLPLVSVAGFQLDGVFIGATRVRELRDSMLISFLVFLGLAIGLERFFGNSGLWCAFLIFMATRGVTLGLRLPQIERTLTWAASSFLSRAAWTEILSQSPYEAVPETGAVPALALFRALVLERP